MARRNFKAGAARGNRMKNQRGLGPQSEGAAGPAVSTITGRVYQPTSSEPVQQTRRYLGRSHEEGTVTKAGSLRVALASITDAILTDPVLRAEAATECQRAADWHVAEAARFERNHPTAVHHRAVAARLLATAGAFDQGRRPQANPLLP